MPITSKQAIAAGKAMYDADDDNYFDPMDMRGIGWDDICEDLEGAELRDMENAIRQYLKVRRYGLSYERRRDRGRALFQRIPQTR